MLKGNSLFSRECTYGLRCRMNHGHHRTVERVYTILTTNLVVHQINI